MRKENGSPAKSRKVQLGFSGSFFPLLGHVSAKLEGQVATQVFCPEGY